jgi:hypothetical protein
LALIGAEPRLFGGERRYSLSAVLEDERVERISADGLLVSRAALAVASGCEVLDSGQDSVAIRDSDIVELSGNTFTDAGRSGISIGGAAQPGSLDAVVDGNLVSGFGDAAIDAHATGRVLVARNDIRGAPTSTGAAVAIRYPDDADGVAAVTGNGIRAGLGDGVYVENAVRAFVWDNEVFSSGQSGVFVRGTLMAEVVNTLAYNNAENGIHLDRPGMVRVFNNTTYGNGGWGLLSEGATGMAILNNIFDLDGAGSVAVGTEDGPAVDEGFNLTTGDYLGLDPADSDLFEDPLFVDADGPDDVLGGDGANDDDFRLRADSPAIDAGSDTPEWFGISGSATEGGQRDTGPVDLGFHYGASPRVP